MTLYRDPLAGLKSQVATKRGLVEQRERELAPLMRAMLPAALRKVIDEGRSRMGEVRPLDEKGDGDRSASGDRTAAGGWAMGGGRTVDGGRTVAGGRTVDGGRSVGGGDGAVAPVAAMVGDDGRTMGELSAIDAAMDGLVRAYDEAIAMVPKLRECPLDVADPPKPALPPPWLIEESRQRFFRVRFEGRIAEISAEAYVVRWGDSRYLTRLTVAGAPIVATTAGDFDVAAVSTTFTSTLRTSVHSSCPALAVKLQTTLGGVAKALRLARDDATGDPEFDDAFLVDGPNGGSLLLTADVRGALRELAGWGASLVVRNGLAEVMWGGTFHGKGSELLHDAAFSVVLGIRAAIERA